MSQSTRTKNKDNNPAREPDSAGFTGSLRKVPESVEAEAAVLGSMILDYACIGQVVEQINAEAFARIEHQTIFNALISLYEQKRDIDMVLLRDELKKRNKLTEIGGVDYLVRVAESVPSSANVLYYVEIVKDKAMLRDLILASTEILNDAYNESGEVTDKLDIAEQKIFAVTEKKISGSADPIQNLLIKAFDQIQSRKAHQVTGLATGFDELDEQLCGLQKGEMIVIAGRPSMGKTSFALNIAEHIGAVDNTPVAIFSLEMSKQQLVERFLCSHSKIDLQKVRKGLLRPDELEKLRDTSGELYDKPIYIDDTPGMTPLMIRAKCRRLKSQYNIQCVLIDYLQLMSLGGRVESRQQEVSEMSRYIKALARELEIPVVVLSQLNRAAEGREGHRPRMSDLRESGSIEQDADVIILLHREDYYHKGEPDYEENNTADVIVAKQRNGPTGVVNLYFGGEYTRFENLSGVQDTEVPF